jgi:uroporphyrinogen III methyltransferase / synthase
MTVYLVGAGPGDPGLLTVRAAELLARADVVVHDRLAESSLLELAPAGAERIDVGKAPGAPVAQDHINELLVARGRAGLEVVRLKGGDPFVFGRGGEEAIALAAAGVAFEVVPGITSAVAVPAYAGIPVTHRALSTSFTVVTGHSRHTVDTETDWESLAAAGGTIVILMGVAHRDEIARRLIGGGLDPVTPVAAVTWGTRPEQRTVRTTLDRLGATDVSPPATIVVGAVAGLDLAWYTERPLWGRRVVVTRARAQSSELTSRLRRLGAAVVELPTIATVGPADGGAALATAARGVVAGQFAWVVLTSANAVEALMPLIPDARAWAGTRIAAVGPATADALARHHLIADLVPQRAVAEGLVEAFVPCHGGPSNVLWPRAAASRDVLIEGLEAKGWGVQAVEAYRTVAVTPEPAVLELAAGADAVCFTSSSTVTNYLAAVGPGGRVPSVVASIGPVTSETANAAGLTVTVEADPHTVAGLVDALAGVLSEPRG